MTSIRIRTIEPFRVAALLLLALAACRSPQPEEPAASGGARPDASVPQAAAESEPTAVGPGSLWETYHGPPSLDGVADIQLPDALAPVWSADVGAAVLNPPVTGNNRICVADAKGGIHAFDWNGQKVWSKAFTDPNAPGGRPTPASIDAPLALFDSTLIACTAAGAVYALDAADGALRWETDTGLPILGTPNLVRETVDGEMHKRLFIVDQSDGAFQCLDFDNGRILWVSEGVGRCDGSPSVNDEYAVFGSCAAAIHVFPTDSKDMAREIFIGDASEVAGGVVLLGESVFSGSRSGAFVHANVRTGETLWTNTDCQGEAFSTPAVNEDRVLFSANDGGVYALDRQTGKLLWKRELDSTPSSPVIAGDKALVAAGGALHLLRLSDGEVLASHEVSDEITSPALAGSLIVVGADDGTITAFGGKRAG